MFTHRSVLKSLKESCRPLTMAQPMDDLHPRQRDRLLNSVLFLAARTSYCGTAKLYRLLYLFDVHHFRLTGVTATGEDYLAYEFGPLPIHLDEGLNRDWWKFELRGILAPTRDPSIDFSQIAWSAPPACPSGSTPKSSAA
jgi:hypothetical protein